MKHTLPAPTFLVVLLGLMARPATAQIPVMPGPPQPASLGRYDNMNYMTPRDPTPRPGRSAFGDLDEQQRRRNEAMIQADQAQYEADVQLRRRQQAEIDEAVASLARKPAPVPPDAVKYQLPSHQQQPGAAYFHQAVAELKRMLAGKQPMSIKRAVYLAENAYLNNSIPYAAFEKSIRDIVQICRWQLLSEGFSLQNQLAIKNVIHQYMSDTIRLTHPKTGQSIVHYPMTYDFMDYRGKIDYRKTFVTKLLETNTGQCHSMPLLYLILAQEMGVEAFLSFSPDHTYVKLQDDRQQWYNLELTNGYYITDDRIMRSGYLKVEAVKNKLYMHPLNTKQIIATCLGGLAGAYVKKYDYDSFVIEAANVILQYHPNNVQGLMLTSNYRTVLLKYAAWQIQPTSKEEFIKYPRAASLLRNVEEIYARMDNLGFEQIPEKAYEEWLSSIEKEKSKLESSNKLPK